MSRKNKIVVSITGITIVILALLGITYAYYLTRIEGNTNTNSISITTTDLKLTYNDGNGIVEKNNFMPGDSITKTFTIENTGKNKINGYTIVLEDVVNELTRREDLKYDLICTLDDGTSCGESEDNLYPKTSNIAIIYSNDIDSGIKHNYELVVNYIYLETIDQSDDMGSNISGRVNIYDAKDDKLNPFKTGVSANDNKSLAYNIIENARLGKNGTTLTGTALGKIGEDPSGVAFSETLKENPRKPRMTISDESISYYWTYADGYALDKNGITLTGVKTCKYSECYKQLKGKYIASTDIRQVASVNDIKKEISKLTSIYKVEEIESIDERTIILTNYSISKIEKEEKILATTIDDFGNSYYYRGDVEDNYLNFAGMCWKIVRILGDGTIRLILEDQNTVCENEEYSGDWSLGEGSFGYYIDEYQNEVAYSIDLTNSNISNVFKSFQNDKLTDYIDKMEYGKWCYDTTAYSDTIGENKLVEVSTFYSQNKEFYYGSYTRIMEDIKPTLKCPTNMLEVYEKNNLEFEQYIYVSTLTVDELAFAGLTKTLESNKNFLKNNVKLNWWTISLDGLLSGKDGLFIFTEKNLINNVDVSASYHYRPAINLKKDTKISSGDGTKTNPYVIE